MGMAANVTMGIAMGTAVFSFAAMRTVVAMGTAVFSSMGIVNVVMGTAVFGFAAMQTAVAMGMDVFSFDAMMATNVTLGFAGGLPFVVGVVHRRQAVHRGCPPEGHILERVGALLRGGVRCDGWNLYVFAHVDVEYRWR